MPPRTFLGASLLLACLLVGFGAGLAHAQEPGGPASGPDREMALEGRIADSATLRPVADAVLTVLAAEGEVARATTDGDGRYRIADLEEGVYRVLVEHPGYGAVFRPNIRLVRRKVTVLDVSMTPIVSGSDTVTVIADAAANDPRAPVTTTTLDREDLRRSPGTAGDVFRALDSLPGVAATGEYSSFTVRGRGPRDNLILVDGLPFDKVLHFEQSFGGQDDIDGGGRYSIFAPNLIAAAEFQPGGWTAAYGGRNGSLLQLRVAEGNRETPSASLRVEIVGWELIYDGPSYFHDKTSLLVSVRDNNFGKLFDLISDNTIGDPSFTDVIVKTTTELSPRHKLSVLGIWSPEEYERDLENVLAPTDPLDVDPVIGTSEQDSGLLGVNWTSLIGTRGTMTNSFFFRSSDKRANQSESFPDQAGPDPSPEDIPVREDILSVDEGETELGWRGDYTRVNGKKEIFTAGARVTRVGYEYDARLDGYWIRYVYDQDDFRPDPDQKYIVLKPEFVNSEFDDSAIRAAGYAENTFRFGDRWTFTPGMRYDYDGFTGNSDWSPRLAAGLELSPKTRLHTAAGVFYQNPRFLTLVADPANADLKSERSLQFVFGARQILTPKIDLGVELYHQQLDDLIVSIDRTTTIATNDGEGCSSGIDLQVTRRLLDRWSGGLTYSFSRSRRDDNDGRGEYDSDYNRTHAFNIFGSYEMGRNWILSGKWRYATGRPTDAYIVNEDVFGDPDLLRFSKELTDRNVDRLPAFNSLNVRVDYRRRFGPISLIAFVDVFNVYARDNIDALRWNELVGDNREGGLNVLPTFGIKIEY